MDKAAVASAKRTKLPQIATRRTNNEHTPKQTAKRSRAPPAAELRQLNPTPRPQMKRARKETTISYTERGADGPQDLVSTMRVSGLNIVQQTSVCTHGLPRKIGIERDVTKCVDMDCA